MEIVIDDAVVNAVRSEYIAEIKKSLIKGEEFLIEGLGVLKPRFRNVKNDKGRNYTVVTRLDYSDDFREAIIESCSNNNHLFKRGR